MCYVQTIYTQLVFLCLRLLPKLFLFCLTILLSLDSFQFIVCALIWLMEVPVGGCCILLLSPDCKDLGTWLVLRYRGSDLHLWQSLRHISDSNVERLYIDHTYVLAVLFLAQFSHPSRKNTKYLFSYCLLSSIRKHVYECWLCLMGVWRLEGIFQPDLYIDL